jgi:hypothetical protein
VGTDRWAARGEGPRIQGGPRKGKGGSVGVRDNEEEEDRREISGGKGFIEA